MGFIKGLLKLIVLVAVLLGVTAFVARFMDGPLIMLPGGPLTSGEMVTDADVDWAQFKDVQEVELESDGRSRITWILVKDDTAYIPASLAFPPGKTWHEQILIDPVAMLRINGKRYPVTLKRVDDEAEKAAIQAANAGKYQAPPGSDASNVWLFEISERV
ncbi:MAG: hypothetical protein NXH85_15715 [Pseudomonadaceae bacterium]|nr:hypothetical protein [Pseudomonadaceae bacterium]